MALPTHETQKQAINGVCADLSARSGSRHNWQGAAYRTGGDGKACPLAHRRVGQCECEQRCERCRYTESAPRRSRPLETSTTRTRKPLKRDTNCDIFSWVSSQFCVWAWNMAAMAAASSSFVTTDLTARACTNGSHDMWMDAPVKLTGVAGFERLGAGFSSSLPSNRFEMLPGLDQELEMPEPPPERDEGSGVPALGPALPMYIATLPLPGRTKTRFTRTDDERGMM